MLNQFSNQMADAVASAAPSVVQVNGGRRPVSGLVLRQRRRADDDARRRPARARAACGATTAQVLQGDLAGWDPATQLAVLRVPGLESPPIVRAAAEPRVGHLALAIARSWSNAVTATAGLVSVIGGPLATGRRRAIDRVIRTSAPMHEGFSGGAFVDTGGALLGVATAISIRGLGVVIPAAHGLDRRGHAAGARKPEARISWDRRAAGERPREAEGRFRPGGGRCSSWASSREVRPTRPVCSWETSCSRSTIIR